MYQTVSQGNGIQSDEIDDSLYSRQRYVLGDDAMRKLAGGRVAIFGVGGLGVEIAKNVILSGVNAVTLIDWEQISQADVVSNFFVNKEDADHRLLRVDACLSQLRELNPGVCVESVSVWDWTDESGWQQWIKRFTCVVLTESSQEIVSSLDIFCHGNNIPILAADCRGLFGWIFADFGTEFPVTDESGEDPKDFFVGYVTQAENAIVNTLDGKLHGLVSGDNVQFREIQGMEELNGQTVTIEVIDSCSFSIGSTLSFTPYESGGIATEVKTQKLISHESYAAQKNNPKIANFDFGEDRKVRRVQLCHLGWQTLLKRSREILSDRDQFFADVLETQRSMGEEFQWELNSEGVRLLDVMLGSSSGSFPPLFSSVGGVVAQEVLKALTGKFHPLSQFLYLDAAELYSEAETSGTDSLALCIGKGTVEALKQLRLFMVGCGAIGCELLKIFALLGIGTGAAGFVSITDNDLIEKSNLNRQFLFRPHHVQQSKSVVASKSIKTLNSEMQIRPYQMKVCKTTESEVFTDELFYSHDVVVNALDTVEARMYMDSRCLSTSRPLFESGTLGTKGHVQVILPHLTESYSSQRDPPEQETPFCTLKSFPAKIEHTIQWARNKFESLFVSKPAAFNKFWSQYSRPEAVVKMLNSGEIPEGLLVGVKLLTQTPETWRDCLELARLKFEKYFNHKARQLLAAFPEDHVCSDGSLFWQSPKRPPVPQEFQPENQMYIVRHEDFVRSCAKLLADCYGISVGEEELNVDFYSLFKETDVPNFVPKNKRISLEENEEETEDTEEDACEDSINLLSNWVIRRGRMAEDVTVKLKVMEFEKDDDLHIDFITATSNLRAAMYRMDPADRYKTKRIAGKIVPAIATTTACVSGLVATELVKWVKDKGGTLDRSKFNNTFLNLAFPELLACEPAACTKLFVLKNLSLTIWDKLEVKGTEDFLLSDFIGFLENKYLCEVSMVSLGEKLIYLNVVAKHKDRLNRKMTELCAGCNQIYVDLAVSLEDPDATDFEDSSDFAPIVRYYF